MEQIVSYSDINAKFANNNKSLLLIYKSEHLESECAFQNLNLLSQKMNSMPAYTVDVNTVLDIHSKYKITSIPSLLIFENTELKGVVKGCHTNKSYKTLITKTISKLKLITDRKPTKSVVVYSTPSCGWCTSLKTWLQSNGILYSDIDISSDEKAAQDLIKRSGHRGVPQIDINGQMVVGFQLPLLKELLEIK